MEYTVGFDIGWNGKLPPEDGSVFTWYFTAKYKNLLYAVDLPCKPTDRQVRGLVKEVKRTQRGGRHEED